MKQFRSHRKTTPKVVKGKVRKKNRATPTTREHLVIDRQSPAKGCKHVVTKADIRKFIDLIDDWEELAEGLERITLTRGNTSCDGIYEFFHKEQTAGIELSAWPSDLWIPMDSGYVEAHLPIFKSLGLSFDPADKETETVLCRFTTTQAKAFSLLHIFLHELGHHAHQKRLRHRSSNFDEGFAERFANERTHHMFDAYVKAFGDTAKNT